MSEAPERIWVSPYNPDWQRDPRDRETFGYIGDAGETPDPDGSAEYIRADLAPSWKPIETAPRDGTWVILYAPWLDNPDPSCPAHDVEFWIARFLKHQWRWFEQDEVCIAQDHPTHWMPLPQPLKGGE